MKRKILVVDDSGPSRVIPGLILRPFGFLVFETTRGEEALEMLRNMSVDVVLLDMHLPDFHGVEVFHRIRHVLAMREVKVIAHTTVDSDEIYSSLRASNFDAILPKPCKSSELIDCIRSLLIWQS